MCLRTCNGPIKVKSLDSLRVEIANVKAAAEASGAEEVFISAVSPGLIATGHANAYYPSRGEYLAAIASAMREEYEEIANAGLIVLVHRMFACAPPTTRGADCGRRLPPLSTTRYPVGVHARVSRASAGL